MILFTYSSLGLTLPSPKEGDTQNIKLRTRIYRSLDTTVWSYISTPNQYVFNLQFGNLNRPKILEVIAFLKASAGHEVWYTDYDNVRWKGHILTQPFESTHVAPRNNVFNLEFEGVRL